MAPELPLGFRVAGVHCGVKKKSQTEDCVLFVSDRAATAAGVYTQNVVFAAPVAWDRALTPHSQTRCVLLNSGNANACTGERGLADARRMAELAAATVSAQAEQALVLSTGVIGEFLPMDKIAAGVQAAAAKLGRDEQAVQSAARGMMTTDTGPKIAGRTLAGDRRTLRLLGLAKGAAMIGPNMATMLCVIMTDAPLAPATAQAWLAEAVDDSFNCLSVEGHMSTNDTVLLLANGAAGDRPLSDQESGVFREALQSVCAELARAIANDGEGATHLIELRVEGCRTRAEAMQIAKTVANSALVKTAIHGADPNWGRIVSAAGYAGVPFNPQGVSLTVQQVLLYEQGRPVAFDAAAVSQAIGRERDTAICLRFSEGDASVRFWTSDLTAEYVHLNADYHT